MRNKASVDKRKGKIGLKSYVHKGAKRKNNPPVGLVSSATDYLNGMTKYEHDPHVDPYLSWAGKKECTEVEVRNVSLHIHERIDAERIARGFLKRLDEKPENTQMSLFQLPNNEPPLANDINFYGHNKDWANRLIAGDSLLVMNSLLNKEGMAGKVQMIYIDPPYGIKYNSNFQPFVNKRDVKDNNDADIPAEPEMIKAFRDTWELEIHSYLSHLRNRLLLAKELLHDTGSIFVQISDENLHHVKELLDEIFDRKNFFSLITFRKTSPLGTKGLPAVADYILWYAKDKEHVKYRELFQHKGFGADTTYTWLELQDGTRRKMTAEERSNQDAIPNGARAFCLDNLRSSGYTESCFFPIELDGKVFPPQKYSWKTNKQGIEALKKAGRLQATESLPYYVRFHDDFPVTTLNNVWDDVRGEMDIRYVVQTSANVISRCLLMTTDPGDLILDPTCGSGTTAFVAEQWGRR